VGLLINEAEPGYREPPDVLLTTPLGVLLSLYQLTYTMPLYLVYCPDKADGFAGRMRVRQEHVSASAAGKKAGTTRECELDSRWICHTVTLTL